MVMERKVEAAGESFDAASELNRVQWKFNAISSFFMSEGKNIQVNLEGNQCFGFAFLLEDIASEIEVIADRLEGGSDGKQ